MDLDLGDDPLYVRMAQAWIVGKRDKVFQTLMKWPQSKAILGVVLIAKALDDFDTETLERVKDQAETLSDLAPLLWHDPVDIEAALRNIDKKRWERIDIALRNLVYPGNDRSWETYEKLEARGKINHLKHLRDIGRPDAPIDTTFLHQLLVFPTKRREIQKLAGGSAGSMPNISKGRLEAALIEVPPLAVISR
jgi:hypothetical protein